MVRYPSHLQILCIGSINVSEKNERKRREKETEDMRRRGAKDRGKEGKKETKRRKRKEGEREGGYPLLKAD